MESMVKNTSFLTVINRSNTDRAQLTNRKPISRAQLPLLLAEVTYSLFGRLLFVWYGFVLDNEKK